MKLTRGLLFFSVVLATALLALGYGFAEWWTWALPIAGVGVLWLLCLWRRVAFASSVGLVLSAGVAAAGLLLEVGAGWMLGGLVAALSAWDLDAFLTRVEGIAWVEGQRDLERRHLVRLLIVDVLGLMLAVVALQIEIRFTFGVAVLLGLLAIVGLSRAIGFVNRESN
jgi:hypothetical protein